MWPQHFPLSNISLLLLQHPRFVSVYSYLVNRSSRRSGQVPRPSSMAAWKTSRCTLTCAACLVRTPFHPPLILSVLPPWWCPHQVVKSLQQGGKTEVYGWLEDANLHIDVRSLFGGLYVAGTHPDVALFYPLVLTHVREQHKIWSASCWMTMLCGLLGELSFPEK